MTDSLTPPVNSARPLRRSPSTVGGAVITKRVKAYDRTTLVLSYSTNDANDLRALVQRIRLKGDKRPTLSVLARRALHLYLQKLPAAWDSEIEALNEMTTPVPQPARRRLKRSSL